MAGLNFTLDSDTIKGLLLGSFAESGELSFL